MVAIHIKKYQAQYSFFANGVHWKHITNTIFYNFAVECESSDRLRFLLELGSTWLIDMCRTTVQEDKFVFFSQHPPLFFLSHTHTHIYTHMYTHIYKHTRTHTHMHTHIYTHTSTHTHTHTRERAPPQKKKKKKKREKKKEIKQVSINVLTVPTLGGKEASTGTALSYKDDCLRLFCVQRCFQASPYSLG